MIYPISVLIETTNRCNASCIYCASQWGSPEPCDMSLELYKEIIDNCPWARKIHPQQYGEPLLYPDIVKAVGYAKEKGKYVWISTNASLLSADMATQLLKTGLDKIIFSVDADEKATYEQLRVGLNWETVLGNIENFQKLRNKGKYKTRTVVNIVSTKENIAQIQRIYQFWKKRVDGVAISPETDVSPPKPKWVESSKPVKCERIFRHLTIRANGDVVLCCRDSHKTYVMGNVKEELPIKVFNSPAFNRIREAIRTGINLPALCVGCRIKPVKYRPPKRFNASSKLHMDAIILNGF